MEGTKCAASQFNINSKERAGTHYSPLVKLLIMLGQERLSAGQRRGITSAAPTMKTIRGIEKDTERMDAAIHLFRRHKILDNIANGCYNLLIGRYER